MNHRWLITYRNTQPCCEADKEKKNILIYPLTVYGECFQETEKRDQHQSV